MNSKQENRKTAYLSDLSRHGAGPGMSKILIEARRRVGSNAQAIYQCDRTITETGEEDANGIRSSCPICMQGTVYEKGIATATPFVLTYDLGGRYASFACVVGVDDTEESPADWAFQVYLDGDEAGSWTVPRDQTVAVEVDTTGAAEMILVGLGGDAARMVDLAEARLTEAAETPEAVEVSPTSRQAMFELDDRLVMDCEVLLLGRTGKKIDSEIGPDETAVSLGGYGRDTASRGADMWAGIKDSGDLLRWQAFIRRPGTYRVWVRVVSAAPGQAPDSKDYSVRIDGAALDCELATETILTRLPGERFAGHLWGYLYADLRLDWGLHDVEVENASGAWLAVNRVVLVPQDPLAEWFSPGELLTPIAAARDVAVSARWEPKKLAGEHFVATDSGKMFPQARASGLLFAPDLTHFMPVYGSNLIETGKPNEAFIQKMLSGDLPFTIHSRFCTPYERPVVDEETYQRIRRVAGDRWQGFWTTEWSDIYNFSPEAQAAPKPKTRREAYERVKAWYQDKASYCYNDIMAMCTGWAWDHYAGEWGGVSGFQDEPGPSPEAHLRILFPRGAARQYGKFWHTYIAPGAHDVQRTMTQNGYLTPATRPHDTRMNPEGGASLSWIRRMMYLIYMWGASSFKNETPAYETDMTPDGKPALSPMGEIAAEFLEFTVSHKDRGVSCTPVGIMLDTMHGWGGRPMYPDDYPPLTWVCLQPDRSDYMKDALFQILYPGQSDVLNEWSVLSPTPYGDLFDVMLSTATPEHIQAYPVLMLVGDLAADMTEALAGGLQAYVRQGGTLVVNVAQLADGFPEDVLGVRLTDRTGQADSARCDLDGHQMNGGTFSFRIVQLAGARSIVSAPSGEPLVTRHEVGDGAVILTMVPFGLQENLNAVCFLPHVLDHLTSGLLPLRVTGDVEYVVNRNEDSWLVTLLNNRGVYKLPAEPESVDRRWTQRAYITLAERPTQLTDWVTGQPMTAQKAGSDWTVSVDLPPGDFRIVRIRA